MVDYQEILSKLHQKFRPLKEGGPATYIPELAHANLDHFAIVITTAEGEVFAVGDSGVDFSMQSTSKPFTYGLVLEALGREAVLEKVGVEPTGEAFNSIVELEKNTHRPYNPMINSGAIAISGLIPGDDLKDRELKQHSFFNGFLGREILMSQKVFDSEKKTAHRNRSIAHLLKHFGVIENSIDEALDLYFKQCSFMVNTKDLSMMAATLANNGHHPTSQHLAMSPEYVTDVLGLMFTCGMYDTSGKWAYSVGIPAKSGVSGGIFGVVPGKLGIAVYSPSINEHGHSVRGLKVFQELSEQLNLSIFKK